MRCPVITSLLLFAAATTWAAEPGSGGVVPAAGRDVGEAAGSDSAGAGAPDLLRDAIKKSAVDNERWAYTQTTISRDRQGRVKEQVVVRYDPSEPFDVQWTPLKIDGRDPTERQIRKLREDHDERHLRRRSLGELLDLAKATVVGETATTVTFEVPLLKNDNQRLPPEKFLVTVRVNKERWALENVAVRLREAWKIALVVKLKSGEADMDFGTVDPKYAPPITALRADGEGSVLFVKLGGSYVATRTDFKRVTPYRERFKVKLAPLKFLDY